MESKGMDFARKQLEKMGWKEGSGLGKSETGISEALRPKLKFDSSGLGHNRSEEFTYHWWDHAFNKAANSLEVKNTGDGPKVVKKDAEPKTQISRKKIKVDEKALTYGVFQKSGILNNGTEKEEETIKNDAVVEEKDFSLKLSDEELFKLCGRRTAHKGARHGHRCSGKLARVAEQEAELLAKMQNNEKEKEKKKKKREKSKGEEETDETLNVSKKAKTSSENENEVEVERVNEETKTKKKKKKKSKELIE